MTKEMIVKDNTLINASYTLSLMEQRLLLLSISIAQKTGKPITINDYVEIHANDFVAMFGTDKKTVYRDFKNAGSKLLTRQFSYNYLNNKGLLTIVKSNWLQEFKYIDDEATIKILFTKSLIPFISELERRFTSYYLNDVVKLTSVYAIRLYELVIAWKSTHKTPVFEIDDLKNQLGIEPDEYTRMNNFKMRVLDVAITQINELSNIQIEIEQHKKGRKIIGFSFTFVELKNLERDPNTIDWVDELQSKPKREKMTINQIVSRHPQETLGKTEAEIYKIFGKQYQII